MKHLGIQLLLIYRGSGIGYARHALYVRPKWLARRKWLLTSRPASSHAEGGAFVSAMEDDVTLSDSSSGRASGANMQGKMARMALAAAGTSTNPAATSSNKGILKKRNNQLFLRLE